MKHLDGNAYKWRRFNIAIIVSSIIILMLVTSINMLVDPYQVFEILKIPNGHTSNERYNKVDHLIKNPTKYNAYLMGSSKIGLVNPAYAEAYRPDMKYYNLGVFGGHAGDALKMLKALKENNVTIKEVVFGIDIFPYISRETEVTPAYRHHQLVSGVSNFDFFTSYLFVPSMFHSITKVAHIMRGAEDISFDFKNTGHYKLLKFEKMIAEDHKSYINKKFKNVTKTQNKVTWVDDQFTMLAYLENWLSLNNIQAYFFIQPHHRQDYQGRMLKEDLAYFTKRIYSITGIIPNYMNDAQWTNDDSLYYEPKHYRPILAQELLERLFINNIANNGEY